MRERSADSICVTELWFLVMKSPYMFIHFGGNVKALGTCLLAILRESILVDGCGRKERGRVRWNSSGERLGISRQAEAEAELPPEMPSRGSRR